MRCSCRMMRPKVVVTMWTFLLIGLARHAGPMPYGGLALAVLALAAGYAVATTANDIADIEIDRVESASRRWSAARDGRCHRAGPRRTNALAGGIAVAAAIPLGAQGVVIVGSSLAVSYAYSVGPIRLSHRWTLAPLALALAYVVLPYALGVHIAGRARARAARASIGGRAGWVPTSTHS